MCTTVATTQCVDAAAPSGYLSTSVQRLFRAVASPADPVRLAQGYTAKLNAALKGLAEAGHAELAAQPIESLLAKLDEIPEAFRGAITNTGGGYVNHTFFWHGMSKAGDAPRTPGGALGEAIAATFGSFDDFKAAFTKCAATVFGSGWAWLVLDKTGGESKLTIEPSVNQLTPANTPGKIPLLTIDVWEHAYYLKFTKNRPDYIAAWWNVVDFTQAERLYDENK